VSVWDRAWVTVRRSCPRIRSAALLIAFLASAASVHAQIATASDRARLTSAVVAGMMDHRVDAGAGIEHTSGPVFGVQVDASRGPSLLVSLRALGGTLGAQSRSADARDIGEVGADARVRLLSWLDARAGATVRGFTSELARQRWTQLSLGADTRVPMLGGAIEGTAGAALLPYVRVSGHASPRLAMAASMGLRHASRRFEVGLLYQLERYDFAEVAGVSRAEEHGALLLRAGYRLGLTHPAR
jgi:hypothetical protein